MFRVSKSEIMLAVLGKQYAKLDYIYKKGLWREHILSKVAGIPMLDFSYENRSILYQYVNENLLGDNPIDYLEFGVYEGASIKSWLEINQHPKSRFFGFDSFEGLPEDWHDTALKGRFDVGGALPFVRDERVKFIKGMFQDTLPTFLAAYSPANRVVVHLDADLYSSTLFVLVHLNKILQPGSILLFDEFSSLEHEFSAFYDFTRSCYRDWEIVCARRDLYRLAIQIC